MWDFFKIQVYVAQTHCILMESAKTINGYKNLNRKVITLFLVDYKAYQIKLLMNFGFNYKNQKKIVKINAYLRCLMLLQQNRGLKCF